MTIPVPTPIYRMVHIDNLHIYLRRERLHAPNSTPDDGLIYETIHNVDIQNNRRVSRVNCGPGGVIHDYVSFYFGPRSPMLFQLHTGWVTGYDEGQEPIIYLVSSAQAVQEAREQFVFSDGHGIALYTSWFDDLDDLDKVDWKTVYATIWKDYVNDMDRQRRKQAEFLIYDSCDWNLIHEIGVLNRRMRLAVREILNEYDEIEHPPVKIRSAWYYE